MIEIRVESMSIEAPAGGRLLAILEQHPVLAIPFSCREGQCTSCLVAVRDPDDLCEPPSEDETSVLEAIDAHECRLACQLRVHGDGTLVLTPT